MSDLSKELTAEEFLKSEGYEGLSKLLFYQDDKTPDEKLADLMDRYANAKLLEVLTEVQDLIEAEQDATIDGDIITSFGIIEIIETQVKPRYETTKQT